MKFESSPPNIFSRRTILKSLAGASLLGASGMGLQGCSLFGMRGAAGDETPGLGALAQGAGRAYGAAIQSGQLDDPEFAAALAREARMLVPELELKWDVLRPTEHKIDFTGYHKIAAFAHANTMAMRGHTLLWHHSNPAWLEAALTKRYAAEKILHNHIARVLHETAPMIRNWDVVNEAIDPRSPRSDGLRESLWLKALGPGYIAKAFHIAHACDPKLTLVYNDFGFEYDGEIARRKRQSALRLLDTCVRDKVPVHALGLQSHLLAHRPMAVKEFGAFLDNVHALGLKIIITELDLDLSHLTGRMDDRARIAQNYVRAYLDAVQQACNVDMLLTWGLSDRYSWLKAVGQDDAGALPLDANFKRGPLWNTLRETWLGQA